MTDLNKILKKVEGLIARSGSDQEGEARTSAFLACKLIREHGLKVVPEGAQDAYRGVSGSSEDIHRTEGSAWWESMFDKTWQEVSDAVRVDPGRRGDDMRIYRAKYPGTCVGCKKSFRAGANVVSFPKDGKGIYHAECGEKRSSA